MSKPVNKIDKLIAQLTPEPSPPGSAGEEMIANLIDCLIQAGKCFVPPLKGFVWV